MMQEESEERGGKHFAKVLIVAWTKESHTTTLDQFSTFTGLPGPLLLPLLHELEDEGVLRRVGVV